MLHWVDAAVRWASRLSRPTDLSEWVKIGAIVVGAPWALITFRRNNRIKAAELFLTLEDECHQCLPTLLKIDYMDDYDANYRAALALSLKGVSTHYTRAQSTAIDEIEKVLRHFHACYHVRRLGVDSGALARMHRYNLMMCISDRRPELRDYIRRYWPNVFFWAECVGEPWPKRLYIRAQQLPSRLRLWWLPAQADSGGHRVRVLPHGTIE